MAQNSVIEWTDSTWNPVTGCTKISPGCKYCYAERLAFRLKAMGQKNYKNGFNVATHSHALDIPLKWKKPMNIFVNSMSDLFHKNVPFEFIEKVFSVMNQARWHRFQVLTKRAERLSELSPKLTWTPNIWMGVSVENAEHGIRMDYLRETEASVRFVSIEPLLGPIPSMNLEGMDWIIVGGESGPGARPMSELWVLDILKQCKKSNVPFFFKQWGGINKKKNGRMLKGRTWDQMPQIKPISGQLALDVI